jgi:hypothetical protein
MIIVLSAMRPLLTYSWDTISSFIEWLIKSMHAWPHTRGLRLGMLDETINKSCFPITFAF